MTLSCVIDVERGETKKQTMLSVFYDVGRGWKQSSIVCGDSPSLNLENWPRRRTLVADHDLGNIRHNFTIFSSHQSVMAAYQPVSFLLLSSSPWHSSPPQLTHWSLVMGSVKRTPSHVGFTPPAVLILFHRPSIRHSSVTPSRPSPHNSSQRVNASRIHRRVTFLLPAEHHLIAAIRHPRSRTTRYGHETGTATN